MHSGTIGLGLQKKEHTEKLPLVYPYKGWSSKFLLSMFVGTYWCITTGIPIKIMPYNAI